MKIKRLAQLETKRLDEAGNLVPYVDYTYRTEDGRIGMVSIKATEFNDETLKAAVKADVEKRRAVAEEFEV